MIIRVEKHTINKSHELFEYCNSACIGVKNLFNYANYLARQIFVLPTKNELTDEQKLLIVQMNDIVDKYNSFRAESVKKYNRKHHDKKKLFTPMKPFDKNNRLVNYEFLDFLFKHLEESDLYNPAYPNPYRELSSHTAQQTLKVLMRDWKSFFALIKKYNKDKSSLNGRPKLPKYKKKDSRKTAIFTNQVCHLSKGYITLPLTELSLKSNLVNGETLRQVRIIPTGGSYKVEAVYEKENDNQWLTLNKESVLGIDLGLQNFATLTNNIGKKPIVIDGKVAVSINHNYNKRISFLKSQLDFLNLYGKKVQKSSSRRIQKITAKRNNQIDDFMHKVSRFVIEYCIKNNIGTIIVGNNKEWKQNIEIGRVNNQKFVSIPYADFIFKLQYKAAEVGINVVLTEESYTSKASFFDGDEMPVYKKGKTAKYEFSGRRICRGLYKTKTGIIINADVNGAYNIIRKVTPNAFEKMSDRVCGALVHPLRICVC